MSKLHSVSAIALVAGYHKGDFSPVEVATCLIGRIERSHESLNAFCYFSHKDVLAAAKRSEQRWMKGKPLGPLDGVPISIKDLLYLAGWPTLHGSRTVNQEQEWSFDSPCVARLREAGVIFLGKTATPEFGHKGVTENLLFGRTNNPWNPDMTPGGSSGGAGSALGAGLGPLAIGTDGGGSCRKPANFCGVVGMKPTQGRVAAWPASALWPLSSAGPMARSVRDLALLLECISVKDSRDPHAGVHAVDCVRDIERGIDGLKVGFSANLGGSDARQEIRAIVYKAVRRLTDVGAEVDEGAPDLENPMSTYRTLLDSGMALTASYMSSVQREKCDPSFLPSVERGEALSAAQLRRAFAERLNLIREVEEFFSRYSLLFLPTNPTSAWLHGTREPVSEPDDNWNTTVCYTAPFNITGNPAVSVPCGKTQNGMPVGLQIVGPVGRDDLVLRAARAFEQLSGLEGQLAPEYVD